MYIGDIQIAGKIFVNGTSIGTYGSLPPKEFYSGKSAKSFFIPKNILLQNKKNELEILLWCNGTCSISSTIYIGEQEKTNMKALENRFIMSDINLLFTVALLLISLLYFLLYINSHKEKEYLWYALTNLTTTCYLFPFYQSSVPWLTQNANWLLYNQLFTGIAALLTAYFATSFIREFLSKKDTFIVTIIRLCILITASIWIFSITTYKEFVKSLPVLYSFIALQMVFAVFTVVKSFIHFKKNVVVLLAGFSPVILSVIADFIIHLILKKNNIPLISVYGWQGTIDIFLILLVNKFTRMRKRVEYLNLKLEKEVATRTNDLKEANFKLEEKNQRTERDMQLASFVQQKFYPPKDISIPGWDISVVFAPLSNVSGDLYDFFITDKKLDGFCLFDVSGHGVAAALVTMIAKNIIYKNFKEGTKKNLEQVIYGINNDIISSKGQIENYLTGLLFRYKEKDSTLEFVNAGHPHPLIYKNSEDKTLSLCTDQKQYGMIGVSDLKVSFPSTKVTIQEGDIIVCFTDGITETENSLREQFGTERLTKIIHDNKDKTSKEIGDIILHEIKTFAGCVALQDDITIIVLKKQNPDDYIPLI